MTQFYAATTLAEIATSRPAAARVLERLELDYCCGGATRLVDACAARGLDHLDLLAELDALDPEPAPDWVSLPPAQLVDHVEATHHGYLHAELPGLSALAAKVTTVHGARHPELAEVCETFAALRAELEPHLLREERELFPMIRQLASAAEVAASPGGSVQTPIAVLLAEHDRAGELLARLRALTGGYRPPTDGCASYRALYAGLAELEADTHLHVHKENNVLFPAVVALEAERAPA